MIKRALVFLIFLVLSMGGTVRAQSPSPVVTGEASASAEVAVVRENITEPGSQPVKDRLVVVLEEQNFENRGWEILRKGVRVAVEKGMSPGVLVLLLMLPLVVAVVAFLHYMGGLTGYGIFTPAVVAVAFVSTGVAGGLLLFATILVITTVAMVYLRKARLHYWPRRALVLLAVCLGTAGVMVLSSSWGFFSLTDMSIFPVLILILMAEEFVRAQLAKSRKEAKKLAMGTILLAIFGAGAMGWERLQELVLLYPEAVVALTVLINLVAGRYHGMRLEELGRFKGGIR